MDIRLIEECEILYGVDDNVYEPFPDEDMDKLEEGFDYTEYSVAIKPIVPWIFEKLRALPDDSAGIVVKLDEFSKACGKDMKEVIDGKVVENSSGIDPIILASGFDLAFFDAGLWISMCGVQDKQPAMVISEINISNDYLPILNGYR